MQAGSCLAHGASPSARTHPINTRLPCDCQLAKPPACTLCPKEDPLPTHLEKAAPSAGSPGWCLPGRACAELLQFPNAGKQTSWAGLPLLFFTSYPPNICCNKEGKSKNNAVCLCVVNWENSCYSWAKWEALLREP